MRPCRRVSSALPSVPPSNAVASLAFMCRSAKPMPPATAPQSAAPRLRVFALPTTIRWSVARTSARTPVRVVPPWRAGAPPSAASNPRRRVLARRRMPPWRAVQSIASTPMVALLVSAVFVLIGWLSSCPIPYDAI